MWKAFLAAILLSGPAYAQQGSNCAPRAAMLEKLANTYGETRRGMGIVGGSGVMEIFASEASGSWTITVTTPSGVTCMVASGQNFESIAEELPAKGDAA